jgi:hypothetical protein
MCLLGVIVKGVGYNELRQGNNQMNQAIIYALLFAAGFAAACVTFKKDACCQFIQGWEIGYSAGQEVGR